MIDVVLSVLSFATTRKVDIDYFFFDGGRARAGRKVTNRERNLGSTLSERVRNSNKFMSQETEK